MQHRFPLRDTCARWLIALVALAAVGACTVKESHHGHQLPQGVVAELQRPNVSDTRVIELLGTPSTQSAFDPGTWYYISEVQQGVAFFQPEVVDRKVLILHFDQNRVLKSVATLSKEDGSEVTLVDRETPTEGHKLTLLEQLIGNIGRFNSSGN
ncbi:MAG: outer membrane protein assembly factor BamE [Alphaproteobacteria bacterium]|nr:outer membrane protein assembly factor BamE [Alphaproteobacteria bacterium]MCB9928838.1 outer membrane protein assembly factor BamE [Alphaproteobacteria bacterium]